MTSSDYLICFVKNYKVFYNAESQKMYDSKNWRRQKSNVIRYMPNC